MVFKGVLSHNACGEGLRLWCLRLKRLSTTRRNLRCGIVPMSRCPSLSCGIQFRVAPLLGHTGDGHEAWYDFLARVTHSVGLGSTQSVAGQPVLIFAEAAQTSFPIVRGMVRCVILNEAVSRFLYSWIRHFMETSFGTHRY